MASQSIPQHGPDEQPPFDAAILTIPSAISEQYPSLHLVVMAY
jgi:hypothetical protein